MPTRTSLLIQSENLYSIPFFVRKVKSSIARIFCKARFMSAARAADAPTPAMSVNIAPLFIADSTASMDPIRSASENSIRASGFVFRRGLSLLAARFSRVFLVPVCLPASISPSGPMSLDGETRYFARAWAR